MSASPTPSSPSHSPSPIALRWQALRAAVVRCFHAYAGWLVSISWWRFALVAVLVLMLAGIGNSFFGGDAAQPRPSQKVASSDKPSVHIQMGPLATAKEDEKALDSETKTPSTQGEALSLHFDADEDDVEHGERLPNLAMLLIVASLIIKIIYRGRIQAEAAAAAATVVAETESLKRQVMEARMAAMQAQMEPHFLFNTLAGIEHLIETDPPRAATMQKSLIAFLRATMPTLREANAQAERDLGRELAVVQPYLALMQMRMEERLQFDLQVPDGLRSAVFPPMMLQSLVENAIRHGLEPKAEGGSISVSAEVQDGQLIVQVRDTGVGFAPSSTEATSGGIGLSNIRERLHLLFGPQASLHTSSPSTGGACVTIKVPYQTPKI